MHSSALCSLAKKVNAPKEPSPSTALEPIPATPLEAPTQPLPRKSLCACARGGVSVRWVWSKKSQFPKWPPNRTPSLLPCHQYSFPQTRYLLVAMTTSKPLLSLKHKRKEVKGNPNGREQEKKKILLSPETRHVLYESVCSDATTPYPKTDVSL